MRERRKGFLRWQSDVFEEGGRPALVGIECEANGVFFGER